MAKMIIERRSPESLKDHPLSIKTYGKPCPSKEFIDSIDPEIGIIEPIVILPSGLIISGHTRKHGAIQIGLKEVPCISRPDLEDQPLLVESMVIIANKQRVKTNEILAKEAAALAEIESKAAAERRKLGLWVNGQPPGILVSVEPHSRGKASKIVGDALGVGETKAGQLIKVGLAIEAATQAGNIATAHQLSESVNRSVPEAAKIVDQINKQKENAVPLKSKDLIPNNTSTNKPIKMAAVPTIKKARDALLQVSVADSNAQSVNDKTLAAINEWLEIFS